MKPAKFFLVAFCALRLCFAWPSPAEAFDHVYATHGWWEIGFYDDSPTGCTASPSDLSGDVATFRAGPAVRPGEGVAIYGFPLVGALSLTGNIVSGNVTSLSGLSDDVRYLQISAPVQPGNSGGPLLDESGLVIGVVTSRINDAVVAQTTGAIPQNVNFAIKGSVASSFLEVHSIPLETAPKGATKTLPDIGEAATKFTVLVTCE
jgi:hypothetical protein